MLAKVNMDVVFMDIDLMYIHIFYYQLVVENLGKNPTDGINDTAKSAKADYHLIKSTLQSKQQFVVC